MKKNGFPSQSLRAASDLIWRPLAALGLFLLYYLMKMWMLSVMTGNPFLRNVKDFWSGEMFLQAVCYLSLLMYFSLVSVFTLHDERYCRRYLAPGERRHTFIAKNRCILLGREFWIEMGVIAACILLTASDIFFFDLVGGFFPEAGIAEAHLATVAIMLPALLLLTWLAHLLTLNWWLRQARKKDQPLTKRQRIRAFAKQLILTCVLYVSAAFALTVLCPVLATFGKVLNFHPMIVLIPTAVALCAILSYRYIRAYLGRVRLIRRLRKICREERYELTDCRKLYASVFSP